MSKISAMMDVGKRSLVNSQTKLQTVAHNIANKSTEGYSRQRVEQLSNVPLGDGRVRIGMGARAAQVSRVNNSYLEKQIAGEGAKLGMLSQKDELMGRVEEVFNEQINKGLNHYMAQFFNAFRDLSASPESMANRTLIRENAISLANDFRRVRQSLVDIQKDIDQRLAQHVDEINRYTREIAELNEKVQMVEAQGVPANDERDRRDLLVKKVLEKTNAKVNENRDGHIAVTAGDSALLVSGYEHRELAVTPTAEDGAKRSGNFAIVYHYNPDSDVFAVTPQITSGEMGGLLQVRDVVINDLIDKVDTMAHTLVSEVNRAHREGFDRYNQNNIDFFEPSFDQRDAAALIKLNGEVNRDVGKIAAAAVPGAPGDNRIANIIANIQQQRSLNEGQDTLDDYYRSLVGQIGVIARTNRLGHAAQKDIYDQLTNIRESVSGVSLDEETANMIEFQKTYDASARLIRTADEMFDTVLSLKR